MKPRSRFFIARVAVLLAVLLGVLVYAWHDVRARRARTAWDHTLDVAIVVLREPAVPDVDVQALRDATTLLARRMTEELRLYRPSAPPPFTFTVVGPLDGATPCPELAGDGVLSLGSHQWQMFRWTRALDDRSGVDASRFDSRIYVTVRPPRGQRLLVEGESEEGGRVGTVTVDLDKDSIDFALAVVAHELFHTLGAADHYDEAGHARDPDGLAEPDLAPRFPQRFVEVMTRGRPITGNGEEEVLDTLQTLAVGPTTAREIGWR